MDRAKDRKALKGTSVILLAVAVVLFVSTYLSLMPLPVSLLVIDSDIQKPRVLDRNGVPLSITYTNKWNIHEQVPLYDVPEMLKQSFILAEDKRFFEHSGVDWKARFNAIFQNIRARSVIRGASTITEQVVRMLHPRPRTFWSRWVEGFDAVRLEQRFSKFDILEFYLNQIIYASNRRGVKQAAMYYFDRDLNTLSTKETIALAVLVRAPGRLDLYGDPSRIEQPVTLLAGKLKAEGLIGEEDIEEIRLSELHLSSQTLDVHASHFVTQVYESVSSNDTRTKIHTSLDITLQSRVQKILDNRTLELKQRGVSDGAVLVVDNASGEILAWVNAGGGKYSADKNASHMDMVTMPRQPGSALKPFLYASALEGEWTAATRIDDSPLAVQVSTGLHEYHNYSREHYGPVRLREALGNSLNIPAVRAIKYVGVDRFLQRLRSIGFDSLTRHPHHYGEGLALGNGEVTLFELVQAYSMLSRGGVFRPLRYLMEDTELIPSRRIFTEETSSIIADILSDPEARQLEFGSGNLLRFPSQTAVKTGTSTDYRDAWAVGFSSRHTVGVWIGNADQRPMLEVSGSIGPALVLRSVFNELNSVEAPEHLFVSPKLQRVKICRDSGMSPGEHCHVISEWFQDRDLPRDKCPVHVVGNKGNNQMATPLAHHENSGLRILQPTPGMQIAMDPRIPDNLEAFAFLLSKDKRIEQVEWVIDGHEKNAGNDSEEYLWSISPGEHTVFARVWLINEDKPVETEHISFLVKQ